MTTPEVPMDALRAILEAEDYTEVSAAKSKIAAYVRAVDAERDARRDEELALAMINVDLSPVAHVKTLNALVSPDVWLRRARAARAHIEGERAS